jgi:hypothetical protein
VKTEVEATTAYATYSLPTRSLVCGSSFRGVVGCNVTSSTFDDE